MFRVSADAEVQFFASPVLNFLWRSPRVRLRSERVCLCVPKDARNSLARSRERERGGWFSFCFVKGHHYSEAPKSQNVLILNTTRVEQNVTCEPTTEQTVLTEQAWDMYNEQGMCCPVYKSWIKQSTPPKEIVSVPVSVPLPISKKCRPTDFSSSPHLFISSSPHPPISASPHLLISSSHQRLISSTPLSSSPHLDALECNTLYIYIYIYKWISPNISICMCVFWLFSFLWER